MATLSDPVPLSNAQTRNPSIPNQVSDAGQGDIYPRGYPELAALMKSDPETNIFRRFDYLHLRQLLYSQEELSTLEESLHNIDTAEITENNNMSRRYDTNEGRKKLMQQIREQLLEYDQLLINYARISNLNAPEKRNVRHFRQWLGHMNPVITEEAALYKNDDLCTTYAYVSDYSSLETGFRWLAGQFIRTRWLKWIFETTPDHRFRSNEVQYASDERIRKAAKLTAVIGASTSLLVPIIILYFVHAQSARLLCIVFFTMSFSALLALFTKATSSEIFAATAAYAENLSYNWLSMFSLTGARFSAVMVVFVGTGLGST